MRACMYLVLPQYTVVCMTENCRKQRCVGVFALACKRQVHLQFVGQHRHFNTPPHLANLYSFWTQQIAC